MVEPGSGQKLYLFRHLLDSSNLDKRNEGSPLKTPATAFPAAERDHLLFADHSSHVRLSLWGPISTKALSLCSQLDEGPHPGNAASQEKCQAASEHHAQLHHAAVLRQHVLVGESKHKRVDVPAAQEQHKKYW
jgi:hypothetical protein